MNKKIKLLSLAIAVVIAGCDRDNVPVPQDGGGYVVRNTATYMNSTVRLIDVGGHRFAIAQGYHEISICEVTDASRVVTNAEAGR